MTRQHPRWRQPFLVRKGRAFSSHKGVNLSLQSCAIKAIVAKISPLPGASDALRYPV